MTLQEFVKKGFEMMREGAEEETPFQTFLIQAPDDGIAVIVAPWKDDKEKAMVLFEIMNHINRMDAARYLLLSEVWISSTAHKEGCMPSKASDRRSALFALGVDRSGEIYQLTAPVDIAEDGTRTIGLPELPDLGTTAGGMMTNLFLGADRLKTMPADLVEKLRAVSPLTSIDLTDPKAETDNG